MTPEQEKLTKAVAGTPGTLKALIQANIAKLDEAQTLAEVQQLGLMNVAIRTIGAVRFGVGWFVEA
jgi:hypothetical protein